MVAISAVAVMFAVGALLGLPPARPPSRIVVVVIDTLRADHLPIYGYGRNTAPFLARLASEGVVFEHAYSTASETAPAMASLFTGVYPFQHNVLTGFFAALQMGQGVRIDLDRIPEELETLPEAMKRAGYPTYGVSSNINVGREMGFADGFERFSGSDARLDVTAAEMYRRVGLWAEELRRQGRYLLYLHFLDPHRPYTPRSPWYRRYAAPREGVDALAAYDSEINYADATLRRLYRELGWNRDTLLIVTADHGEELLDHGGWGHGETLYAEIVNVPLIVRWPEGSARRGSRVATPVSHVDILPTVREVAGLEADRRLAGRSVVPLLRGQRWPAAGRPLLCRLLKKDRGGYAARAMLVFPWKLIEADGRRMLFDIETDVLDTRDLAGQRKDVADALARRLETLEAGAPRYGAERAVGRLSPDRNEQLRALGYVR